MRAQCFVRSLFLVVACVVMLSGGEASQPLTGRIVTDWQSTPPAIDVPITIPVADLRTTNVKFFGRFAPVTSLGMCDTVIGYGEPMVSALGGGFMRDARRTGSFVLNVAARTLTPMNYPAEAMNLMANEKNREWWFDSERQRLFSQRGIVQTSTGIITPLAPRPAEQAGPTKRQRSWLANSSKADRLLAVVEEITESLDGKQTITRYLERVATPGVESKRYDLDLHEQQIVGNATSGDGRFLILRDYRPDQRKLPAQVVDIDAGTRRALPIPQGFLSTEWSAGHATAAFTHVRPLGQKALLVSVDPTGQYPQRQETEAETVVMLVDLAGDLTPRFLTVPGQWRVVGLNRRATHLILETVLKMTAPTSINQQAQVFAVLRVSDGAMTKAFWQTSETPQATLLEIVDGWGVLVAQMQTTSPSNLYVERFAAP